MSQHHHPVGADLRVVADDHRTGHRGDPDDVGADPVRGADVSAVTEALLAELEGEALAGAT